MITPSNDKSPMPREQSRDGEVPGTGAPMDAKPEDTSRLSLWSFLAGLGMTICSALAIRHFYAAHFPVEVFKGEFCDVSRHYNCDSFDYSAFSQIADVPIAYFELVVGCVVCLGSLLSSAAIERVNRTMGLLNLGCFSLLLLASTLYLKAVCVVGVGYWLFSAFSLIILYFRNPKLEGRLWNQWFAPAPRALLAIGIVTGLGVYGLRAFGQAKEEASIHRAVEQYFRLAPVKLPSLISPYWTERSTERLEDAPIQVIAFGDLICDNSLYVEESLRKLRQDFKGKINIVWQFFPLEAKCNQVSGKDKHPGACEAAYMAAYDPSKFLPIHDELLNHWDEANDPEWRRRLAERYGVEKGMQDAPTQALVQRIIQTGTEYAPTSERYPYGIRSTPTMILNHRMIIGTFTYKQLRAIFQVLVDQQEGKIPRFMENWPDQPK